MAPAILLFSGGLGALIIENISYVNSYAPVLHLCLLLLLTLLSIHIFLHSTAVSEPSDCYTGTPCRIGYNDLPRRITDTLDVAVQDRVCWGQAICCVASWY